MTYQEIFNKVAIHLLNQRTRSTDETGDCRYRSGDGLSCAVGCLIKDEDYHPSFEGVGVGSVASHTLGLLPTQELLAKALRKAGVRPTPRNIHLLVDLQYIHDYDHVERWRERLRSLANFKDLDTQVLDK